MKITTQTFSIVSGSTACNASCPYCISKLTPKVIKKDWTNINWRNFDIACRMAQAANINTVLITGKGEPTLYLDIVSHYLHHLEPFKFPFVELQTNGIELTSYSILKRWYSLGLTHICLSIVHYDDKRNKEIFGENYDVDLDNLVNFLQGIGFTIRLTCIAIKGYIDTVEELNNLVYFARSRTVKQLSIRPVRSVATTSNSISEFEEDKVNKWIGNNLPNMNEINLSVKTDGTSLFNLVHGATVYDYRGQNLCLTNAMTHTVDPNEVRQLIFFPDGSLRYDWQYRGAILL